MMKFYEGFEVWAFPLPETTGPVIAIRPKPEKKKTKE